MPIFEILSGLNPDFENRKRKFNFNQNYSNDYYEEVYITTLTNNFIYCTDISLNENKILSELEEISKLTNDWNKLGSPSINSLIIDNAFLLIKSLPPSILYYLKPENIYPSQFGTIILDWEFDTDNIFSLEIAKKSIGYFVEKDGENHRQVDKIPFDKNNIGGLITSINSDISIFL